MRAKITYSLNLDNIRCFLYGPGTNDNCENTPMYSQPVLDNPTNDQIPVSIKNRSFFIRHHFDFTCIYPMFEDELTRKDSKEKNEFIADICKNERKRGGLGFLDSISDKFLNNRNEMENLINTNMEILKKWDLTNFNNGLERWIDCLYQTEKKKNDRGHSIVCYLLTYIHEYICTHLWYPDSLEHRAKVLSFLLLAALLRERFPMSLLEQSYFAYSMDQQYHIENLLTGITGNLSALIRQLNAQEGFLDEARQIFLAPPQKESIYLDIWKRSLPMLSAYYNAKIREIETSYLMLDYTDIEKMLESFQLKLDHQVLRFLHYIAFYMKDFAKEGMEQLIKYISVVTDNQLLSCDQIVPLCEQYKECLLRFRNLTYWNIVFLCAELPYKLTKDLTALCDYILREESGHFSVYMKMSPSEIKNKIQSMEYSFRLSLPKVKNKDITIVFPDLFYIVGFSKKDNVLVMPELKNERVLTAKESDCPIKEIINVFFDQFKQMDLLCELQGNLLNILSDITYEILSKSENDYATQIEDTINKYKKLLGKFLASPPVIIENPLFNYMKDNHIKTIEFQFFCSYLYQIAADNLHHIGILKDSLPTGQEKIEEFQHHYIFAQSSLRDEILYLNNAPNYWFAECNQDMLTYIKEKSESLHILSIDFSKWNKSQLEAEKQIHEALDDIENKISVKERDIAKQKWEILNMKTKIKKMLDEYRD